MDDVLCDFTGAHKKSNKCAPKVLYPQSEYWFFEHLESIPNTIESVMLLIKSEYFDPYILTVPSIKSPLCYTRKRI